MHNLVGMSDQGIHLKGYRWPVCSVLVMGLLCKESCIQKSHSFVCFFYCLLVHISVINILSLCYPTPYLRMIIMVTIRQQYDKAKQTINEIQQFWLINLLPCHSYIRLFMQQLVTNRKKKMTFLPMEELHGPHFML